MIPRSKSALTRHLPLPRDTAPTPPATVPDWLRRAVPNAQTVATQGFGPLTLEDMALAAGTAIGALDLIVRRQAPWAGAWRLRLALTAAATTAKEAGRVEDEAALRDAVLLTRPGDEVGPAGLLLMAWRRLAGRPAETLLTAGNLAVVLEEFCYAREDAATRRSAIWRVTSKNSPRAAARSGC